MLKKLSLKGVGPAPEMEVEFAERLTVITGDNGLGKSFILDAVWFYFANRPFLEPIFLKPGVEETRIAVKKINPLPPEPEYYFDRHMGNWALKIDPTESQNSLDSLIASGAEPEYNFNEETRGFVRETKKPQRPPMLYFGADGRIGIYEPSHYMRSDGYASIYTSENLKDGVSRDKHPQNLPINGCIFDLTIWQSQKDEKYHQFLNGLRVLSENSEHPLCLVGSERISVEDPRDIPLFSTGFGTADDLVHFPHLSSGMQRIILFVYCIVLAWNEHKFITKHKNQKLADRFIILIDEIETHLHPRWQKKILTAVLEVAKAITEDEGFQVQVICTTHSPIVLTGIEPHFDPEKDKLLDLQLTPGAPGERGTVELREVEFEKLGSVGEWLMDQFKVDDIPEPNAEALEKRAALFKQEKPTQAEIDEVDNLMRKHFAPDHQERTHWVWLATKKGLTLRGQQ